MSLVSASVFCLLLLIDGVLSKQVCSKQDVLDYLNLTRGNEKFTTCRPPLDWTKPTIVYFDIHLFCILSVIEKSQIFVPFLWMTARWNNDLILWDPKDFCGITNVVLPKEMLWVPDLFILEAIEKEEGLPNPYLTITYDGNVTMEDDHKIISTCALNVHKFPFDTQTCHITVFSVNHSDKEIKLVPASNSTKATQMARDLLLTQGEWELLNISVSNQNMLYEGQSFQTLKYT
ncbi:5-hydroxytryptamine receptor 3A [Danio rerio]|uniref:5-hydroxytryptamine receptor 3A n=1 Tax=Danio rerio TaxID=7955 RepID=A0AC58GYA1_DANRE